MRNLEQIQADITKANADIVSATTRRERAIKELRDLAKAASDAIPQT